jgi:hypothetical protein
MAKRISIDVLLKRIVREGIKYNCVVYEILFREAGIAIEWFEAKRVTKHLVTSIRGKPLAHEKWRLQQGLVVYKYHPSFRKCFNWELKRLKEMDNRHVTPMQYPAGIARKVAMVVQAVIDAYNQNDTFCDATLTEEISRRKMPNILDMKFRDVINLLRKGD